MVIIKTDFEGLTEIIPMLFEDIRGYFFESFNEKILKESGIYVHFVQDNESLSNKGILRGLHFQKKPFHQGKFVRVVKGKVLDVAVDIRKNSKTYGKWYSAILDDKNKKILWIPEGFAHGFLSLADGTIFVYKCTNFYSKEHDSGILWNDPSLNIDWKLEEYRIKNPILSEKDFNLPLFRELDYSF